MVSRLFSGSFICTQSLPNQIVGLKDEGFPSFIAHLSSNTPLKIVLAFVGLFETHLL